MSDAGLSGMTARLREIAQELRAEGTSDEQAEGLAREAAELVGEAGNQIERSLRQASAED